MLQSLTIWVPNLYWDFRQHCNLLGKKMQCFLELQRILSLQQISIIGKEVVGEFICEISLIIAFCGVRCLYFESSYYSHYFLTMHSCTVRYFLTMHCWRSPANIRQSTRAKAMVDCLSLHCANCESTWHSISWGIS